jgi:hypothetical protein
MMKVKQRLGEFAQSSPSIKILTIAVILVWSMVLVALLASIVLILEMPGQTQVITPVPVTPAVVLEPTVGPPGAIVTVRGEGWNPGSMVLIYLAAPGEAEPPSYAIAGFTADAEGRFTTGFVVPSEPGWEGQGMATVIGRAAEGGASAQAHFSVVSSSEQPTATPVASVEPTATPTQVVTPTPTATRQPERPTATAITDLNIRAGPGTGYPVLGVLRAGQTAQVTGISADGGWWQIQFSGTAAGHGWLSARYVTAQNTKGVPVVQAPPLPATPTPTPTPTPTATPVVISDWRGEYYNNPNLSGPPALVRNDVSVNFDWGGGSPGSGVPADGFSVRWSRGLDFPAGIYRFYARVDDGVRLWIDGVLVINQWHDSAPTTYSAEVNLTDGWHNLEMEYYYGAVARWLNSPGSGWITTRIGRRNTMTIGSCKATQSWCATRRR